MVQSPTWALLLRGFTKEGDACGSQRLTRISTVRRFQGAFTVHRDPRLLRQPSTWRDLCATFHRVRAVIHEKDNKLQTILITKIKIWGSTMSKHASKHYHIMAEPGVIAETVLLPGDPLRAKFIAENFLENAVCHNEVRGMLGYTGTYNGKKVSVQGTGMGVPSISIYIHELIQVYGAKKLIRIGSCGSMLERVKIRDTVLAMSASTTSGVNKRRFPGMDFAPTADFELLHQAYQIGMKLGMPIQVGSVLTSDLFYDDTNTDLKLLAQHGIMAVEMETAELYTTAAKFGVKALAMLTVSDHIITGEVTTPDERQATFTDMMRIALEVATV